VHQELLLNQLYYRCHQYEGNSVTRSTGELKPNFKYGPSFTSNTATVADGTDHIDPAQLRGLGPDQVLVLVNGKEDILLP
jgi:hypothetical protein